MFSWVICSLHCAIRVQVGAGQQEDIEAILEERTRGPGSTGVREVLPHPVPAPGPHLSAHTALTRARRSGSPRLMSLSLYDPRPPQRDVLYPSSALQLWKSILLSSAIRVPRQPTHLLQLGVVPHASREGEASGLCLPAHLILGGALLPTPHTPSGEHKLARPYQLDLDQHTACSPIPSPEW